MRRKSRKPIGEQFAPVLVALLRSVIWRLLSSTARALWPEVVAAARSNGKGDESVPFRFPQRHQDFSNHTVWAALRAYVDLGLLTVVRPGGLYARATEYALSEGWRAWSPAAVVDEKRREKYHSRLEQLKKDDRRFDLRRQLSGERREKVVAEYRAKRQARRSKAKTARRADAKSARMHGGQT